MLASARKLGRCALQADIFGSSVCARRFGTSMFRRTHYETLDVPKTATGKEIKAAYFALSKQYHPDLNPNDPSCQDKFVKITKAYGVLSGKESKSAYDRSISPELVTQRVYKKEWSTMPGTRERQMNDPVMIYNKIKQHQKATQREKYIMAAIILVFSLTVTGSMTYYKVTMLRRSRTRGDDMSRANEYFLKQQERNHMASLSEDARDGG